MSKDVSFSGRPPASADQRTEKAFEALTATNPMLEETTKRICVDIPQSLHLRIKIGCATEGVSVARILRSYLDRRFPKVD
jgi:predicted DNA binding CopG/RHH family protein